MPTSIPDEEFREFVSRVQELALRAYPNPQRVGCPSRDVIHDVATQTLPADHPVFQEHIVRCSPCIADVIAERTRIYRQKTTRRWFLVAAGLILITGAVWTLHLFWHRDLSQSNIGNRAYTGRQSASLVLQPGNVRGTADSGGSYELAISPSVSIVSLQFVLQHDYYSQYVVTIETPSGNQVWRQDNLLPKRVRNTAPTIVVNVPARIFQTDTYGVKVFGMHDGATQVADVYSFQVTRLQPQSGAHK